MRWGEVVPHLRYSEMGNFVTQQEIPNTMLSSSYLVSCLLFRQRDNECVCYIIITNSGHYEDRDSLQEMKSV